MALFIETDQGMQANMVGYPHWNLYFQGSMHACARQEILQIGDVVRFTAAPQLSELIKRYRSTNCGV